MPFTHNLVPPSVSSEFALAVGWSLTKGYTRVAAFGFNPSIDTATTPEDVWTGGGIYQWMTAATSLELVSSSASDASAGTGARTVLVSGLDINYVAVTQTITLNGVTPVALATQLFRVNSMIVLSAGSGGTNVGTLTLRDAGAGTTRSLIGVGIGITQQAPYTVPAGFTLQVVSIYNSITGTGTARTADIVTYFKTPAGVSRTPITLSTSDGKPYRHDGLPGIMVTEKTDFSMRCTNVSNNGSSVTCAWLGILRQNV